MKNLDFSDYVDIARLSQRTGIPEQRLREIMARRKPQPPKNTTRKKRAYGILGWVAGLMLIISLPAIDTFLRSKGLEDVVGLPYMAAITVIAILIFRTTKFLTMKSKVWLSRERMRKALKPLVIAIALILAALFVWNQSTEITLGPGGLHKVNKITGKAWVLRGDQWVPIKDLY